jgi:hypothetical protein
MGTKKPKLMMNGHTDEVYTPEYALKPLLPYLKKEWLIWENAWGKGHLAKHLQKKGFKVSSKEGDIIVTNPPYSKKEDFLKGAYELGKPFAYLMPLTALEGIKRGEMYDKFGIQLIIPNRRIDFIMPNKQGSSWFQVAWFCWGLNLPKDLMFVKLEKTKQGGLRKVAKSGRKKL